MDPPGRQSRASLNDLRGFRKSRISRKDVKSGDWAVWRSGQPFPLVSPNGVSLNSNSIFPHFDDVFAEPRLLSRRGPWPLNDEGMTRLFVVDEGLVEQYRVIGQRKQIVALHYPSDGVIHWYPGMRLRGTVMSRLRVADDDEVQTLAMQDARVARLLRTAAQRQFEIACQWLHILAALDSDQKLAHFLCEHAWRLGVDLKNEEPFVLLRQQDLADALSVTSVHINRLLRSFDRIGLIERRAAQAKILDWERLADLGCFRETYLQR